MARFLAGVMKFRLLILAAAIGLMAFGIVQLRDARLDVLPEFSRRMRRFRLKRSVSPQRKSKLITVPLKPTCSTGSRASM